MSREGKQALITILLALLISAILVGLAWLSMADLALVGITALVCLGIGWSLGYHAGVEQSKQTRRARRNASTGTLRKRG